jgi:hypothetical protein
MALQDEIYSKVANVVKDGGESTVLGLFRHVVRMEPFSQRQLREIFLRRLKKAGYQAPLEEFLEPETLTMALSLSAGNPRRFLFLISEAMSRGNLRKGTRIEFQDLFEAMNEHLKLDLVCKKLLYFLAKSGRAVASNSDLQAFMGLDTISIARRLEILSKNKLADKVDSVDGVRVYALPGGGLIEPVSHTPSEIKSTLTAEGDKRFDLGENEVENA